MTDNHLRQILADGAWRQNTGLVVLLGLCPLLAVTNTLINGLALGLATMLTLMVSNLSVSAMRGLLRPEIRIPAFVLIIASVVTIIELSMKAMFFDLYLVLGIFIPLIVTNCAIIGRAEGFASRNPLGPAALDGLMMGLGFLSVLVVLGGLREIIGFGTLFAHAELMFGDAAKTLVFEINPDYPGFLLAVLPPGAFFGLALLIAAKNWFDLRPAVQQQTSTVSAETV